MLKTIVTRIYLLYIIGLLFFLTYGCSKNDKLNIVTDIDGNNYGTITIELQVWMNSNLRTTKYNDGTEIPNVIDNTEWSSLTSGAYCWYGNEESNRTPYGALYNWYAINTGKLCPTGWHVPTSNDWDDLVFYLGGEQIAGGKLKAPGTMLWAEPNTGATNETGFTGLPGGLRYHGTQYADGNFMGFGTSGYWWSSTEEKDAYYPSAIYLSMRYQYGEIRLSAHEKEFGKSIRCIKD